MEICTVEGCEKELRNQAAVRGHMRWHKTKQEIESSANPSVSSARTRSDSASETLKDKIERLLKKLRSTDRVIDGIPINYSKNYNNGEALWPLRVALSGAQHSSSPFELLWVCGKEESLQRLQCALQKVAASS